VKKILIVDDAAFMRLTIRNMLEKNSYEVVGEATNGRDAIQKFGLLRPDIVTMDITMPDMDGISALKAILAIDSKANVIMVSAMGQERLVREAILSGAKTFIVKPFKEEQMLKALEGIK